MSNRQKTLLQSVILPVFAASLDGRLVHLGTAFVICTLGRQALLLSAAHVFRQALAVDGSREQHHPSTPLEFLTHRSTERGLKSTRLLALITDSLRRRYFADIPDVYINDPFDIAVCSLSLPGHVPPHVKLRNSLALDTTPPPVGTPIIAAGYGDTKIELNINDTSSTALFEFRLDYRHGSITEVFESGYELLRLGPSFRIDAPISSGMSGGPVINKRYGDKVVVCGINTSDLSVEPDGSASGIGAMAQMLWPSMAIALTHVDLDGKLGPVRLVELSQRGFIEDLGKAHQHVIGIPEPSAREFSIAWR
jgi:hypothetical protein